MSPKLLNCDQRIAAHSYCSKKMKMPSSDFFFAVSEDKLIPRKEKAGPRGYKTLVHSQTQNKAQ